MEALKKFIFWKSLIFWIVFLQSMMIIGSIIWGYK
jgi:hypothetical protein